MVVAVKILGISGSPRRGSTEFCVQEALRAASEIPGVETGFITLRGMKLHPCVHCEYCVLKKDLCFRKDDLMPLWPQILEADGYIIGSPVYMMSVTGQLQSFLSRWRCIHKGYRYGALRNKVGGAIATGGTRNGGQELTLSAIIHSYLARGILVVGAEIGQYSGAMVWTRDHKRGIEEIDPEGMRAVRAVGRRVAETATIIKEGVRALRALPDAESYLAKVEALWK